jgi:signal transduction histidine kinase
MLKNTLIGLDKEKLRRWLLLFFFALAIPTAILIQQSYSRLKWETFHQHQLMADELSNRIDSEFLRLIEIEEQRSFTDYSFLNIAGDPKANLLQRSPLSNYPLESEITGLIGYFQINNEGKLKTPLLPEAIKLDTKGDIYGIADKELASRTKLQNKIQQILSQNSLVKAPPIASRTSMMELDKMAGASPYESLAREALPKNENGSVFGSLLGESKSFNGQNAYQSDTAIPEDIPASVSAPIKQNSQIAFDRLKTATPKLASQKSKLGRLEDLKLRQTYSEKSQKQPQKSKKVSVNKSNKRVRKEQNVLPEKGLFKSKISKKTNTNASFEEFEISNSASMVTEAVSSIDSQAAAEEYKGNLRIRTFESSIDPFEFSQLDSGHFVLYRNVWLNEKRTIQGLLIDQKPFLESIINTRFRKTTLSTMSDLLVSYQGNILSDFSANGSQRYLTVSGNTDLNGELLHQTRLSDPLSELQLLFSIKQLPVGAGGKIILWLSLLLGSVLCIGFYLMYRLGLGQINLANQQQDFVSAVSHELKTPLTSIRMYSEMLREGWANEEKKKSYYDFIFDESERLSRLINNVLHLARVTRNKQSPELKEMTVAELIDGIRSKVSTQIRHAGFEFEIQCDDSVKNQMIKVDEDWFSQIMINLVDNAIKFSLKADQKRIDLSCNTSKNDKIQFSVRDYGQGVDKTQMKKIFDLFYRTESELTRETVGTGIGLALVHQMVVSMKGKIDVINSKPGAEFRVLFPKK